MDFKRIGLGVALTAMAFSVAATPQYTGNTQASGELELSQGFGYYIWNDSSTPSEWRIRWTGDGADSTNAEWYGNIGFFNDSLDSYTEISFEGNHNSIGVSDPDVSYPGGISNLGWFAYTNTTGGYDGLNFTINSGYELLELSLNSNLFNYLSEFQTTTDPGVAGHHIYIGSDYETPNVLISTKGKQQFEISVPEPGTLGLLSLALLGIGAARLRRSA